MLKQIYPVIGDEKELPFYIVGLGVECWQFPITRPEGYEYPQIFVTRSGEGEIKVGDEVVRAMPNTAFFMPAHCPHEYHAVTKDWFIDWVCFTGTDAVELMKKWGLYKFQCVQNTDAERMHRIINRSYYTLISDKLYGNHYASAQLYDLLIEYRRLADKRLSTTYSAHTASLAEVLEYIEDNYAGQIKLSDLAKQAGVTEQHLCRLFKKTFQLRPMEYLAQVRVQHAKELLVYSEKSIGQISDATGFQDSSYFSVVFRRYENMTPGEYRKIKV